MSLWDPGAQPERTALAWSRTTLSLIEVGLLCVQLAPTAASAAVAGAVACGGAALQLRRAKETLQMRQYSLRMGDGTADPVSILIASGLTMLLAVVALLFVLE